MASQVSRCPDCGYLGPHQFVGKPESADDSSSETPQVKRPVRGRGKEFNPEAFGKEPPARMADRFIDSGPDAPVEFADAEPGNQGRPKVPFNIRKSNEALDAALGIDKTGKKRPRKDRYKAGEFDYIDKSDDEYTSEYDEAEDEKEGKGKGRGSTAIISIVLVIILVIGAVYVINNFEEVNKWLMNPTIPEFFQPSTAIPPGNNPTQAQLPSGGSASPIIEPSPATATPPSGSTVQPGKIPPVITGPNITVTESSAKITWNVSEPCRGNLFYNIEGGTRITAKEINEYKSYFEIPLNGLESGKKYTVTIEMVNKDKAEADKTQDFETLASTADVTPPKLAGEPEKAVSDLTATITWKTDEKSTSVVKYGLSIGYEFTSIEDRGLRTEHSIFISALSPGTTYHFQVISRDAAGNEMKESGFQFVTEYPTNSAPYIGSKAPVFSLKTLDGGEVSLAQYRGKKVILNFWASWCSPCKIELPHFQAFWDKYSGSNDVMLLTVAGSGSDINMLKSIVAGSGYTFTVCLDTGEDLFNRYSIMSIPVTYFIDSNGTIRRMQQGMFTSPAEIEFVLDSYN
ncbi:MAG: redoxin domain-containing protein [Dehalococcoidia bacterium]|nr:redoxin domain-containing protein [Dehalococcoidia bacterium]